MPDVSIIIVHWNVPHLLDVCLTSIAEEEQRSHIDVETIIVDNATDTPALRATLGRHPRARLVLLAENRGYAAGCNRGLAEAAGSAALLLNPDTELRPGALDTLWRVLHVAEHVGMVAPLVANADGSIQSAGYRFPGVTNMLLDVFPLHPRLVESSINGRFSQGDGASPYRVEYPLGAAMLVKRSAWIDVGPLDESYGMYSEEIDWARRFSDRQWTILIAPAARIVHHSGQSTKQRPEMRDQLWASRVQYYDRWGTRHERLAAALARRYVRSRSRQPSSHAGANGTQFSPDEGSES